MIFGPRVKGCTDRPIKSDRMAICGRHHTPDKAMGTLSATFSTQEVLKTRPGDLVMPDPIG